MLQRGPRAPREIINCVRGRNYGGYNALDLLYAVKYYSQLPTEGGNLDSDGNKTVQPEDYNRLVDEILRYFPEVSGVLSRLDDRNVATLTYTEYGNDLDILYCGTGLKHFLDVLLRTTLSRADVILLDEPEMGLHPDLQRHFVGYLHRLSEEKCVQVFMATHSPVLLNYADVISYYRVTNRQGHRKVTHVPGDAIHTLFSDLGIRPSDVFNTDICLLVEGASDVIFFEHGGNIKSCGNC